MKEKNGNLEKLYENDIFAGIEKGRLESVLNRLDTKTVSYEKGAAILLAGNEITSIGLVLSGLIHIIKEDYYGNRSIMAKAGKGQLFGEVFACAGLKISPVSIFAAESASIMFINCEKILTGYDENESELGVYDVLRSNLLRIVSEKALYLNQKIDFLSKRTTREKLLAYLSSQADRYGSKTFAIPFNRQELADFLCVERSAMSAELSRMKRDGLIDYNKNLFHLF